MYLSIFARQQSIFTGKVTSVTLPGHVAPFQVLKDHINLVSTLDQGTMTYHPTEGAPISIPIQGGIAKVKDNTITVLLQDPTSPTKA